MSRYNAGDYGGGQKQYQQYGGQVYTQDVEMSQVGQNMSVSSFFDE
ncbi:11933_t:CDS:2, partial [Acaulospora morrowiae]